MKKISFLFSIFFVLLTFSLQGQVVGTSPPPATDYHTRVQHVETVTTYYVVDELTEVTDLDKAQLKVTTDVKQLARYYSEKAQTPTTVINRIKSENIYSDWMTQPAQFVINDEGIVSYDAAGNTLKKIPHSKQFLEQMDKLDSEVFTKMTEMSQQQINDLKDKGINVLTTAEGDVVISGIARSISYNYANKSKTITKFDGDGKTVISTIKTVYKPVMEIDPQHPFKEDVLPIFEKEIRKVNLPSGACAELVTITKRQEYAIRKGEERSEEPLNGEQAQGANKWYPNPVANMLTIENKNNETLLISIYTLQGQKLKEVQTESRTAINIAELSDGVFILSIKSKHNESFSKFVKF